MTATTHTLRDSRTMLRRQVQHLRRYPSLTIFIVATPVVVLLLFVAVFGGALGAGLSAGVGAPSGDREAYLAYMMPGVLLLAVIGSAQGTAISIAMDMVSGIVARFRTMAISRAAVLTGHVGGSVVQVVLSVVVATAVAVFIGFRSSTGPLDWLAAAGLLLLIAISLTWLSVALGMSAKSVETASNTPMILLLLLVLSSAFVPTATLPDPLRWFAENQPFTPMVEALRSLLLGTPMGSSGVLAVAWALVIGVVSYVWSMRLYDRRSGTPVAA